jgi:hypothetical protein
VAIGQGGSGRRGKAMIAPHMMGAGQAGHAQRQASMAFHSPFGHVRVLRLSGWQIALGAAFVLALALAFTVLLAGILAVVVPACLIGGLAYRWLGGRRGTGVRPPPPGVIEVDYQVIGDRPSPARPSATGPSPTRPGEPR